MKNKLIIGLTGFARAGKDSFADLAIEDLSDRGAIVTKIAIAAELKNDIQPFLKEKCGIEKPLHIAFVIYSSIFIPFNSKKAERILL